MEPRQIQLRYDTSANWSAANPVLAAGEAGFETDTNKIKVGDGVMNWLQLPYLAGEGGGGGGGGSGDGDMKKAVYDVNNNGIVDKAQSVPWIGVSDVPSATTGHPGIVQLATADNLFSENLAATPAGVKAAVDAIPSASTTMTGLIRFATHSEIEAGTSADLAVSPKEMADAIGSIGSAQNATETTPGIARIATQAEVNAGTLDNAIVTPKKIKSVWDSIAFSSWRPVCPPLDFYPLNGIDHDGNGVVVVACGDDISVIYSSLDHGLTWTLRWEDSYYSLNDVRHGNGRWVAVGRGGSIYTSTDTVNWKSWTIFGADFLSSVDYGNGWWVVGGEGNMSSIARSSNGQDWSAVPIPSLGANRVVDVCHVSGSTWLALFSSDKMYALRSTDNGLNWGDPITISGSGVMASCFVKVPDGILAIGNNAGKAHIYKSQNGGNSWEFLASIELGLGSNYHINRAFLTGDVVLGVGTNGAVVELRNGIVTKKTAGLSCELFDGCDTGQRVLVCGDNGNILTPVFPAG